MRLHLDTSFLIDWYRSDPRALGIATEITDGAHSVSVDVIIETEFFSAQRIDRKREALFRNVQLIGTALPLTSEAARIAASWLAPMDEPQRRAHFADALIGAIAQISGAVLVTGDRRIARVLPMPVLEY